MDTRDEHQGLIEALEYIEPSRLDYQEWVNVGMALHESGYSWQDWDAWSSRDPARYHAGECERKWNTFGHGMDRVKSGTIVDMAKRNGWSPGFGDDVLDWDSVVTVADDAPTPSAMDLSWVEPVSIRESATDADPAQQLSGYIKALFEDDEYVGYVTESWVNGEGRAMPTKGSYDRTAVQLREELARCGGDLGKVLGDYNPEVGAWIRFNPLDGQGVGNTNVTEYRYALVESDVLSPEKQLGMIKAMNLPCAAIVASGNKSVHAIVKIDAGRDYDLYRQRVEALYTFCRQHGFQPDTQNKNPSRLSRMPGVKRGTSFQSLIEIGSGAESWTAWQDWIAETQDDLPDTTCLAEKIANPDPLSEPIIGTEENGILRRGHKMLIAGPSKAGKSFLLMQLAKAIAEGGEWCGYPCMKGRVLYINLEIDSASCVMRFRKISEAKDGPDGSLEWARNLDVWNLRGHAVPMDELTPRLIHRAKNAGYSLIVIDPIYKVITGDENNASEMSAFCNQFDKVATSIGAAVVYCHHHSKGAQGSKKAMDRSSGSGVFARDPDAILDLAPIEVPDDRKAELGDASAWRMSATLREFATPKPINLFFRYPVHIVDADGELAKYRVEGEEPSREEMREKRDQARAERAMTEQNEKNWLMEEALADCEEEGEIPTRKNVLKRIGEFNGKAVTDGQLTNWTQPRKSPWTCFQAVRDEGTGLTVVERIDGSDEG